MRNATRWTFFPVEWTRCTFGGRRPWFICSCGKRVAKLYGGGIFIGCRHCYNMIYECQRRGEKSRALSGVQNPPECRRRSDHRSAFPGEAEAYVAQDL